MCVDFGDLNFDSHSERAPPSSKSCSTYVHVPWIMHVLYGANHALNIAGIHSVSVLFTVDVVYWRQLVAI